MYKNILLLSIVMFLNTSCGRHFYGNGDCYPDQFADESHKEFDNDRLWFVNGELRQGSCDEGRNASEMRFFFDEGEY